MATTPPEDAPARGRHRAGGGRGGRLGLLAVATAALAGTGLLAAAFLIAPAGPPQPSLENSARYQLTDPDRRPDARGVRPLDRSAPVRVKIPSIKLDAVVVTVGTNADGSLQVPELRHADLAGWYRYGPSPGERGNAVIVGHVDTRTSGPAVFFELGALKPGTKIEVSRLDGSVAVFSVDVVKSFPKDEFPATRIYGSTDDIGLRLVTCGPPYNPADRNYLNNVVVFASLTKTRPAAPVR
ncbi:class F sortase [Catellatospora bangladeshensis]|uniref:Class F sortase n=1 Tax=Catellatospora bangladeshensis TaxID=310355 RepID=A0A8J3JTD7_9ACTN|nr:class F sortase [Catellatospora bangladeshensis]GIF84810.1 class F sortase [Catellatospora bangladeshensis]